VTRAARRAVFPALLLLGAVLAVAAVAALAGSGVERSLALGLYAVGSLLTIFGFGLGTRNLFRSAQSAHADEQAGVSRFGETMEAAAVMIVLGIVLLLLGTAADPNARLI